MDGVCEDDTKWIKLAELGADTLMRQHILNCGLVIRWWVSVAARHLNDNPMERSVRLRDRKLTVGEYSKIKAVVILATPLRKQRRWECGRLNCRHHRQVCKKSLTSETEVRGI